jgi:hypothetical protein
MIKPSALNTCPAPPRRWCLRLQAYAGIFRWRDAMQLAVRQAHLFDGLDVSSAIYG